MTTATPLYDDLVVHNTKYTDGLWAHQADYVLRHGMDKEHVLLWQPRVGKSLAALRSVLRWRIEAGVKRVLLAAPKTVCQMVWAPLIADEAQRWAAIFPDTAPPQMLDLYSGAVVDRANRLRDAMKDPDAWVIAVVNRDALSPLADLFVKWGPGGVVLDELHDYKTPSVSRARAIFRIARGAQFRRGLTGTPASEGYCLDPETKVLTAALRWVPLRSLEVGEQIVGFDEFALPEQRRRMRTAAVTASARVDLPSYTVCTDKGIITACADHMWLCCTAKASTLKWVKTKDLTPAHRISYLCAPWDTEMTYEAGYLAGIFDGEGSVSEGSGPRISFAQNPGTTLNRVKRLLDERQVSYGEYGNECKHLVLGGVTNTLRFLGTIRPVRLIAKARALYDGVQPNKNKTMQRAKVISITDVGVQRLHALATTTNTFIADGYFSHNCDMYGQWKIVSPKTFGTNKGDFLERYVQFDPLARYPKILGYKRVEELREKAFAIASIVRRSDCFEIPPEQDVERHFDLPPAARKVYDTIVNDHVLELAGGIEVPVRHTFARLAQLRQIATGYTRYLGPADDPDADLEKKVDWLHDELLSVVRTEVADIVESGEKIVVWHAFSPEREHLLVTLKEYSPLAMHGGTSDAERARAMRLFAENPNYPVLVVQEQLGALGLSMAAANYACFASFGLSRATHIQARDRIFKPADAVPGKTLTTIYPLARGTVVESMRRLHASKASAEEFLLSGDRTQTFVAMARGIAA